jgi:hypothetical protein
MSLSYTPDEILQLAPAIERMGGALLPEKCEGRFATYSVPGSKKTPSVKTCNCKQRSMYVMPYSPVDSKGETSDADFRARGAGYARTCVHCDLMGSWPNFENVLESADE